MKVCITIILAVIVSVGILSISFDEKNEFTDYEPKLSSSECLELIGIMDRAKRIE